MRGEPVELVARRSPASEDLPYERLLGDAIRGDTSLFTPATTASKRRGAWSIRSFTILPPVVEYEPGTWGPPAAAKVIAGDEGWHDPQPETTTALDRSTRPQSQALHYKRRKHHCTPATADPSFLLLEAA